MFRKGDSSTPPELPKSLSRPEATPAPQPVVASATPGKASVIGASLHVKGEITGAEDLSISGIVEGSIELKQNTVTVMTAGRVQANVYARIIHVEGEITGDLFASEVVVVHKSGQVKGNIKAPRVSLEEGARIKGAIDTDNGVVADPRIGDSSNKQDNSGNKRTESSNGKPSPAAAPIQ